MIGLLPIFANPRPSRNRTAPRQARFVVPLPNLAA
jgi:hypothetical protein